MNKALKIIGKYIGIGLVLGAALVVQHIWNKIDLDDHSKHTQHAIEENKQDTTRVLGELQAKFDTLQQENDRLKISFDDCVRANASLRHDMQELKRLLGVKTYSDRHGD